MTTEYTPTTDDVRERYHGGVYSICSGQGCDHRPEFNRWRTADHREVAVKTLREAAERIRRNLEDSLAASYLDAMADDRLEQSND